MPLRYLLDEHLRGALWDLVKRHNRLGMYPLDCQRVGDIPQLPIGTSDPVILRWTEAENRVLVSQDKSTLPNHLAEHLGAGRSSPGVMVVRPRVRLLAIFDYLVIAAYASQSEEWANGITYIP